MNYAVEIDNVSRSFGSVHAVIGLDLNLVPGEVLGLLGHNGAGKSTTMKMVLGVLAPSAGTIRVLGENPRGPGAGRLRLKLGYLPENVSFYDNLTGREVLRYFARLKRVAPFRADALLERVGLKPAAGRRVRTYSKGMRQRLGLAQALIGEPQLLLLDEPTVGLDPMATRDVYGMIDELRGRGTSVILCSHVLPGVERHIDRAAILARGQLLAAGTIEELRQQANLPLRIRARTAQPGIDLHERLNAHVLSIDEIHDNLIEVSAIPSKKMDVMRRLLSDNRIEDLSVELPNLDTLYAHFNNQATDGDTTDA